MHSQKICHQDLKPSNILLRAGEMFLTDFGIARNGNEGERSTTDRHVGHTRGYAPPEVMDQDSYNPREADIFSLGYEFLHILTVIYRRGNISEYTPYRERAYADFGYTGSITTGSRDLDRLVNFRKYLFDAFFTTPYLVITFQWNWSDSWHQCFPTTARSDQVYGRLINTLKT